MTTHVGLAYAYTYVEQAVPRRLSLSHRNSYDGPGPHHQHPSILLAACCFTITVPSSET